MSALDLITAIASSATAIGVIIAVVQLFQSEKLAKTEFEDQFRRDYRDICAALSVKVFLGNKLSSEELDSSLGVFHQYFHLCNSQIFLRGQGKISATTWTMWSFGIKANLDLDGFKQAWNYIHTEATSHRLQYLSRFLDDETDPKELLLIHHDESSDGKA